MAECLSSFSNAGVIAHQYQYMAEEVQRLTLELSSSKENERLLRVRIAELEKDNEALHSILDGVKE